VRRRARQKLHREETLNRLNVYSWIEKPEIILWYLFTPVVLTNQKQAWHRVGQSEISQGLALESTGVLEWARAHSTPLQPLLESTPLESSTGVSTGVE
jgi:hypothetical protein